MCGVVRVQSLDPAELGPVDHHGHVVGVHHLAADDCAEIALSLGEIQLLVFDDESAFNIPPLALGF